MILLRLSPGDILPPQSVTRADVAVFSELWAARSRRYAQLVQGNRFSARDIHLCSEINPDDMRDFSRLLSTRDGQAMPASEFIDNTGVFDLDQEKAQVEQYREQVANARREGRQPVGIAKPLRFFGRQCDLNSNLAFAHWLQDIQMNRGRSA